MLVRGRLTPTLRRSGLHWQDGYYDRKLRADDNRLPLFLYIFLNPNRAGLIKTGERWPGFFCRAEDWEWFGKMTDHDCPMPEWLE